MLLFDFLLTLIRTRSSRVFLAQVAAFGGVRIALDMTYQSIRGEADCMALATIVRLAAEVGGQGTA